MFLEVRVVVASRDDRGAVTGREHEGVFGVLVIISS